MTKRAKPTRADKRHFSEVVEAINEAYAESKPIEEALRLIMLRRWDIEGTFTLKLTKTTRRVKELESTLSVIRDTAIAMDDSLKTIPPTGGSVLLVEVPRRIKDAANAVLM